MLIRMYLPGGKPEGLKTLELSNSTVLGTVVPRQLVREFEKRRESSRPGVYLLLGPDDEAPDLTKTYVGEGDPVVDRIRSHDVKKDFWTKAYVFTSKDDYLTKTQIKYLEHQLHALVQEAGRSNLDNATIPTLPTISEPDAAEMDSFLSVIRLLLAATGVTVLESHKAEVSRGAPAPTVEEPPYEFHRRDVVGYMRVTPDGYVVLKGSTAVKDTKSTAHGFVSRMRDELIKSGVLMRLPSGLLQFTGDAVFESPSTAASVIAGANTNGRTHWKRNGVSLKEDQEKSAPTLG